MTDIIGRLTSSLADRYQIQRELGQGGMAIVYLAHDLRHNRKVALKVLRPELAAILGGDRFLKEIQLTANLQHPHILPLHDSGEVDGVVYYVMPFVEGESLRDRLNRDKQLPVDDAVRIAKEIASALDYAHRHNVVHRDIKPENVLLHDGQAIVADFGIALAVSTVGGGTRMTETGMSLGTPHYMAPEQAMGDREITPRADIYALGCVLYESLTGDPPFTGSTAQAIVARVVTESPRSLTSQRHTIPPHVEATVMKALEKLPADRFASAAEFAAALGNPAFGAGLRSSVIGHPSSSSGWRLAAALPWVLLLVAGSLAAWGWLRVIPEPPLRLAQFVVDSPDSVRVTNRCCGRALALSPDGATLVFVGARGPTGPLYRRSLGRLDAEEIPGTDGASIPFFSPDGRWLAFFADGRLRKVSMAGGPAIPITAADAVSGASWGEGDVIVFSEQNRIKSVPAAGGQPRVVATSDSSARHLYPFFLPGGTAALFSIRQSGTLETSRIGVVDLASGAIDTLAFGTRAEYAAGHLVYAGADNTLMAQPFDVERRVTTGDAVAIMDRIRLSGNSNHEFALSTTGGLAILPGTGEAGELLRIAGPTGRTTIPLPGRGDPNIEDPAVSPDGRLIALRILPSGGGATSLHDIWLLDRQQGTLERLTVGGGWVPVWSRDGRSIAYTAPDSGAHGPAGIYLRAANQTGGPRLLLRGGSIYPGSWLPDGRTLLFQAQGRPGTAADIGSIGLGDSVPSWLIASEFREVHPQASPDGRWLAHTSNRTGEDEVYVQPLSGDGGRTQVSTGGGSAPRWSPDGRTLYYIEGASIVAAAIAPGLPFRVASRRTVVEGGVTDLNRQNSNFDVFPNGREFIHIDLLGGGTIRPVWMLDWPALASSMRTGNTVR